jgi:hypothetical protein
MVYSFGRAFIESIRLDPSDYYFGLRTNVWSAIFGLLIGMALLAWSLRKHKTLEDAVYLPGREPKIDSAEDAATPGQPSHDELDSEGTTAADSESKS